jgi:hypothetical protein
MKLTTKAEGLSKKLAQHAKVIQQKSSTFTSDAVLLSADGTTLQVSEGHCISPFWRTHD